MRLSVLRLARRAQASHTRPLCRLTVLALSPSARAHLGKHGRVVHALHLPRVLARLLAREVAARPRLHDEEGRRELLHIPGETGLLRCARLSNR